MNMHLARRVILLSCLLGLQIACGQSPTDTDTPPMARLQVQVLSATATTAGVVIEVTAADIASSLVVNLTEDATTGVWSGSLDVPVGSDRTFTGRAFDDQGMKTHEGSVTTDVVEGTNTAVSLSLNGLVGDVPIEATIASHTVSVSPSSASIVVGGTQQFDATVTDSSCTPTWASTNPGIATVDASGLATGHAEGTADIVANCAGVSASGSLTVGP